MNDDSMGVDPLEAARAAAAAAIRRAFLDGRSPSPDLDSALIAYVRAARGAGHAPERTLGVLKSIAAEVCPPRADRQRVEDVSRCILDRCLHEYFDRPGSDRPPPG